MLPSDNKGLLAKWQGPFQVLRKLGSTTYAVAKPGGKRSKQVLYVNLLKEWCERPNPSAVQEEDGVNCTYPHHQRVPSTSVTSPLPSKLMFSVSAAQACSGPIE